MSKTIRCLVVDDEPLAAGLIQKHIEQTPQLEWVASCWNALEAFELLKEEQIDLLFLDIQMPVLNGLEFIKSLTQRPAIILTTAYREYALEGYELDVVDYLLKPITFERFFRAVNKYLSREQASKLSSPSIRQEKEEDPFLYVNTNRKFVKIHFEEVLYIESLKDYIQIHLQDKQITTKEKISEFLEKLPSYFLRVHRSFIINTKKVSAYSAYEIEVEGQEIPIGISYKQEVMKFFRK
ncbi:MAG: LytTR family DNA-binding domain-containing protein [Bacteroidota bacterium]